MNDLNPSLQALQKAQQALQKKKIQDAHYWATVALKEDETLVDAWLILAAVSKAENSARYLERALQLDPDNKKAKQGLQWLEEQTQQEQTKDASNDAETKRIPFMEMVAPKNPKKKGLPTLLPKDTRRRPRIAFRWQSLFAVLMCMSFVVISVFAPALAPPENPENPSNFRQLNMGHGRQPEEPSSEALLGTVDRHYDIYYSLIWGTRQSLIFGVSTALITAIIGTFIGAVSAFIGGRFDNIVMRITDAFLSFPIISAVALFILLQSVLSPEQFGGIMMLWEIELAEPNFFQKIILNANPVFIALIFFSWMPYARIIHTQVLEIKQTQYIDAAQVVGVRPWRIIRKHIIPNAISPAIVLATRDIGRMVVVQATFTYIGLGGTSTWATILAWGSKWIIGPGGDLLNHWWVYLPITLMLILFSISWNLLGDEINVQMNPQANGVKY